VHDPDATVGRCEAERLRGPATPGSRDNLYVSQIDADGKITDTKIGTLQSGRNRARRWKLLTPQGFKLGRAEASSGASSFMAYSAAYFSVGWIAPPRVAS
jgi:hypothetical protein